MPRNQHYRKDILYITLLTRNILKVLGVWPCSSHEATSLRKKVCNLLLILVSFLLLYCVLIPGTLFWMVEKRTRVRIQTIPLLLYGYMAIGKYSNLIFHESKIRYCLKYMEEDWKNVRSKEARGTMMESAKTGRRLVALCGFFMYTSGISFRSILPLSKGKIVTEQNVTLRPLPCPGHFFFFDVQASPVYETVFVIQFLSGLVTFSITTGVCGLAAIFVMHACGQLKILMDLMKNLVEEQWKNEREVNRKLATVVEHQIRVRAFLRIAEDTLHQMCLIELMGSTIIVCIVGYCILQEWQNNNTIPVCSYFVTIVCVLINMFVFCYTGEQLTVEAEKVATTSCELEWYRLPERKARAIVLVMVISGLPTKITAGKLMNLSLRTFGNVVKASVTYLNMLRNVID